MNTLANFLSLSLARSCGALLAGLFCTHLSLAVLPEAEELTSNGITWTFSEPVQYGTFVTGDYWVIGPVTVVGISNSLNSPSYTPRVGQNGSMVNPLVGHDRSKQGYDDGLGSYVAALNAGRPGGEALSPENPLELAAGDTLVSMVSWLYNSSTDREPGCPSFNGGTGAPRPVTRSAGILTVLDTEPSADSFRPSYAGNDNTVRYGFADIDQSKLPNLTPPSSNLPNLGNLEDAMRRPWVDHVFEYLGAMVHPSEHMPNYGRDMGHIALQTALMLQLDFGQLSGSPSKDQLLINLVQYGIDLMGIADNGGGWRANGGHALGRKWPILFAGLMLDDARMQNAGTWGRNDGTSSGEGTEFQEFQNCFYVSQVEVDITHSTAWKPDSRDVANGKALPYEVSDIGTPEWGIRHSYRPTSDNAHIDAIYRDINAGVHPGFALACRMMGAETLWNHNAFLDYCDRIMDIKGGGTGTNALPDFAISLWNLYRAGLPAAEMYEEFQQAHFSEAELLDSLVSGDLADPDLDGRPNFLEYFLHRNPRVADGSHLKTRLSEGRFCVEIERILENEKVRLFWEYQDELDGPWTALDPAGVLLRQSDADSQVIEYQFSLPEGSTGRFFRLRIEHNPGP